MSEIINNELVRYSRAGDAFHYRWAAQRCLKMLNPLSRLEKVIIEGSSNSNLAGEYVIDVSEYYSPDENGTGYIKYFQLKHTTVQKNNPFTLSDLKGTICGFSKRYIAQVTEGADTDNLYFYLVSNRPIATNFEEQFNKIIDNKKCTASFMKTIEKYTGLAGEDLVSFLKCFKFMVGEGDYSDQMRFLHLEVANLVVGTGEHPQIDSITALVSDKALPHSDGAIIREDILKRFGCTSLNDLFPAPIEYEKASYVVPMKQHEQLVEVIIESQNPVLVHAAGGVGKSIFAREVKRYLHEDSISIVYDCFGAGKYRNRSRPRHRYRDALVQISNELSQRGLCDPIIAPSTALEDDILRKFIDRIQKALMNLKRINPDSKIVLIIDAADNAEMAAAEFGDSCFVHELLREELPEDCHLAMLCRTERQHLLQPDSNVRIYELEPFSEKETLALLRQSYETATDAEGYEFHRLTNGNPRIQSNALSVHFDNVLDAVSSLGPKGTTVDQLIENQLERAVAKIQDKLSPNFQKQINNICTGLATLPPYIPISILAKVAQVEESMVLSFVSDLGKPIWIANSVVQFRDEPTETWFRQRYAGTKQQILDYVTILKPMANQFTYVAEILPNLLLQAEEYDELIELALSNDFVPIENPVDKRNIIVYRLQFALKAALKLKKYDDAAKIAMLAGEEMAGNKRQIEIFKKNIDLIAPLQYEQKVQELAFKRMLSGTWEGSENVYSASLLSNVPEFHGEANSYLRASMNWLKLYLEERKKKEGNSFNEKIENEDIAELAFAHYNLNGPEAAIDFILGWNPASVIYNVTRIFSEKMIDLNKIEDLHLMAKIGCENNYFVIAIAHELLEIGLLIQKDALMHGLDSLSKGEVSLPELKGPYGNNNILKAVISFAELCTTHGMCTIKIGKILDNYFPRRAPESFDLNHRNESREIFLRSVALRIYLFQNMDYDLNELLPEKYTTSKVNHKLEQEIKEYKEIISTLLPWYLARIQILFNTNDTLEFVIQAATDNTKQTIEMRYNRFDILPSEISKICVDILLICKNKGKKQIDHYFDTYILNRKHMWMDTQIRLIRGANRLEYLSDIRNKLEAYVFNNIEKCEVETEIKAEYYIGLSRATLSTSKADAAEYFNMAITMVSRFGDELPERWRAITEIAEQSCEDTEESPELSHRFIRCAELVGENVAREKYFDRSKAMEICTKLSTRTGMASLSRWRDRNIGCFEDLLPVVITETVRARYVSPQVAWAFVTFIDEYRIPDFMFNCLKSETDHFVRDKILNQGIHLLRLINTPSTTWIKLKASIDELNIINDELDLICVNIPKRLSMVESDGMCSAKYEHHKVENSELMEVFRDLNLMCSSDIANAYERFKTVEDSYSNRKTFWEFLFQRISDGAILEFIMVLLEVDDFDGYVTTGAFSCFPEYWKTKPSVKKIWPEILLKISKKYPYYLLDSYNREAFINSLKVDEHEQTYITQGVISGLVEVQNLETADVYFGVVNLMASLLDFTQARGVLDFSLSRLEMHMEDDFGDGQFSSRLEIPDSSSMTVARFIWSALGSPFPEIRWKSVHSVRLLGENGCQTELDALIHCLTQENVQDFGSSEYPFYYLHAKLYLLMAFARLSKVNSEIFKKHSIIFSDIALNSMPHILIQMHAKRIALNIDSAFCNIYEKKVIDALQGIGHSLFEKKIVEDKREYESSIWHVEGTVNSNIELYHGYDFERYWFAPLGKIFGIPEEQVEELATMIIVDEWKIKSDGSLITDPRQNLWNSTSYENKTHHDHGGYPKVETYGFYLSFHAMFVVAARLIKNMPVLCNVRYDAKDNWAEWLKSFMLTQSDELFLYDRRDEVPLILPEWLDVEKVISANNEIEDQYFVDTLLRNDETDIWVNVCSSWKHGEGKLREEVNINSAFVEIETSQSLLNALSTCKNPHDYKIPDYDEDRMEFDENPFNLKGWIIHENSVEGLDRFDKLSGNIYYPEYKLGNLYSKKLNLRSDKQFKYWFKEDNTEPLLKCKTWSYETAHYGESEQLQGMNLFGSLELLKQMCRIEKKELVIEVQIRRFEKESRYSNSKNDSGYTPPRHKVFILSMEGRLRDERGNIEFRKASSR